MFKILKINLNLNKGACATHKWLKNVKKQYTTDAMRVSKRDTINALRPFYMLVHPDFFVQHPSKRATNESSLQKLNSYLEALHSSNQSHSVQPTKVEFYSKAKSKNGFNFIQFTLHSKDVSTNIKVILSAFNLPSGNIAQTASQRSSLLRNNVFYEDMFYDDVEATPNDVKSSDSLSKWLSTNIEKCRKEQEMCAVISSRNEQLKDGLCMLYGIREIQWLSTWQHTTEQGTLKVLARTCKQHGTEMMNSLQGRRLVFTDRSFPAADESICLNVEDVPLHWMQFISDFDKKFSHIYKEINQLEKYMQRRLGNIQIRRPQVNKQYPSQQRLQEASKYLNIIRDFSKSIAQLKENEIGIKQWALRDNTMKITLDNNNLILLSEQGDFLVSHNCAVAHLIKFIMENQYAAKERIYCDAATKKQIEKYKSICCERLGIKEITKDWNVPNKQMLICCEKLCSKTQDLPVDLSGLRINITKQHYSIFNHGRLGIPWNWAN